MREDVREYARRLAAEAPPLTPEQVSKIRAIFSAVRRGD